MPISDITYFISPPHSFAEIIYNPFYTVIYFLFILTSCYVFLITWIEVSGTSARNMSNQLCDSQMAMKGHCDSDLVHVLNR